MSPEEKKLLPVEVEVTAEKDIPEIIDVEEKSWISSYPNEQHSIIKNDVSARFSSEFKKRRSEEIGNEIRSDMHSYRVARENGKIVAYSHLLKEEEFGDLVEVYVLPDFQGQGYGGALIMDGLEWLGGHKPVRLEVAVYNPAVEIYKHFGFVDRPDLKQASDEDWNKLPSGMSIPVKFMEKPAS